MKTLKLWTFSKHLLSSWNEDRIASFSASLAYYTVFSLAPILLICIAIAGLIFGPEAARGEIVAQISGLIGPDAALQVQTMIESASKPAPNLLAKWIGVIVLIFGASGMFNEIQTGLNTIWGVKAKTRHNWLDLIKNRFLSFTMVLGLAFLLLVSLILSALLMAVSAYVSGYIGSDIVIKIILSYCLSFLMITLLFAMMFKVLPDVHIEWKDVWFGALITSLLFSLGKLLLGIYLLKFQIATAFGAASSLIIILIWTYYTAQIFFIGAEITKVITRSKAKRIIPARKAIPLNE